MYAIVQTGGHQYKVAPGDTIEVESLDAEKGADVELGEVLMIGDTDGDGIKIGTPFVKGAKVLAKVVGHGRGEKIVVFKFKAKKRYRRKTGHRQGLTTLAIKEISV